jgi:DNA-binding NtrC family response regulator
VKGITKEALDQLMKYEFNGNVRELENMIERAVVFSRNEFVTQSDLPTPIEVVPEGSLTDPQNLDDSYEEKLQTFERQMIKEALDQTDGNQSAAARKLGMSERHIRSRMERLGMK